MAIDTTVRTYIPKLLTLVRTLCIYITRYSTTIEKYLNDDQKKALAALSAACSAFLTIVEIVEGT